MRAMMMMSPTPRPAGVEPMANWGANRKRALMLWFHAKNIEKVPEGDDSWTRLPGLHCRPLDTVGVTEQLADGVPDAGDSKAFQ